MMNNATLTQKNISMTIPMIIDDPSNGSSGYMLLYGSNADVGGYQIEGTVNKDEKGTITYDMTYTFNDIIDPNFRYKQDKVCYIILEQLKKQMIR